MWRADGNFKVYLRAIVCEKSAKFIKKIYSFDLTSLQLRYKIEIMINTKINITEESANAPIFAAPNSRWFMARSNKENGVR